MESKQYEGCMLIIKYEIDGTIYLKAKWGKYIYRRYLTIHTGVCKAKEESKNFKTNINRYMDICERGCSRIELWLYPLFFRHRSTRVAIKIKRL